MASSSSKNSTRRKSQIRRGSDSRSARFRAAIRQRWSAALEARWVWIVLFVLLGSWALVPRRALPDRDVEPGMIADRTWIADRDLVLIDDAATEAVRLAARAEVLPVYDFDHTLLADRRRQLAGFFQAGRDALAGLAERTAQGVSIPNREEDVDGTTVRESVLARLAEASPLSLPEGVLDLLAERGFAAETEERLTGALNRVLRTGVVADKELLLEQRVEGILVRTIPPREADQGPNVELDLYRYLDYPEQVEQAIDQELRGLSGLGSKSRTILTAFLVANVAPNLTPNSSETRALEDRAAAGAGVVSHGVRKGEVIVRKRERIGNVEARILEELRGQADVRGVLLRRLGAISFLGGAVWLLWIAFGREGRADRSRSRFLAESLLLMAGHLLGLRFGLFVAGAIANSITSEPFGSGESYLFAVPFAALPMAAALLYGRRTALVLALVSSIVVGPAAGAERMWMLSVYAIAGSLAALFALDPIQFKERSMLSRAGLVVGLVQGAAVLALRALAGELGNAPQLGFDVFCGLAGGILSAATVSFVIPILESLLGITTHIKLIELANPNLPLLRRLAFEAPGTFQHSLAVANLAKSGCEAIDRDAVLVHTCALYHDIGKISRPRYFVENQVAGQNPHDRIQPTMSALILINHVKEGSEMARSHALPQEIVDGIEQHHGTRLIKFFFARARERCDPETEELREEEFRYPGPKPGNKEMGVLMLADAVEAASRTLVDPSQQKLRGLVRTIVDDCLQDRQLDRTDLTLGDLRKVEEAFVRVLTRVYHKRVEYPGFDFNRPGGGRERRKDDESGVRHAV